MNSLIKVTGLPVSKIFYNGSQPNISNGLFQIENKTAKAIQIEKIHLKIEALNSNFEIRDFFIYKQPDYVEIQKSGFIVEAFSKLNFDISFPVIADRNLITEDSKVVLSITINGKNYVTNSKINFTRRMTKN